MSNNLNIAKCFEIAKKLALQTGEILKSNYNNKKIVEKKGAWDAVTNYDRKIERILIDGFRMEFPGHKIIAEETVDVTQGVPELTDAPTWILDPIDGTLNFIHALPHFCISVGLTVCKEPVLGIIYDPVNSELYSAIKNQGAFLNEKPIGTSEITELKKALLLSDPSGMIHYLKPKDTQIARNEALSEAPQCLRSIGSAALSMAYVARGIADCFCLDGLHPWDIVAGVVIVREAGGVVMETKGGSYDIMNPNTIAASNEILARKVSQLIIDTDLKVQGSLKRNPEGLK